MDLKPRYTPSTSLRTTTGLAKQDPWKGRRSEVFVLEALLVWRPRLLILPCSAGGLFQRSAFSLTKIRPMSGRFSGKSHFPEQVACLEMVHTRRFTPPAPRRQAGSVAVHAILGAKWSALAISGSKSNSLSAFYVEAKECSLKNGIRIIRFAWVLTPYCPIYFVQFK
jgi:hypothetical protein